MKTTEQESIELWYLNLLHKMEKEGFPSCRLHHCIQNPLFDEIPISDIKVIKSLWEKIKLKNRQQND
jgi:hypothetical protein